MCKYESVYIDFKINAKRIEDNISFFILRINFRNTFNILQLYADIFVIKYFIINNPLII